MSDPYQLDSAEKVRALCKSLDGLGHFNVLKQREIITFKTKTDAANAKIAIKALLVPMTHPISQIGRVGQQLWIRWLKDRG
jgi:hypothetical protein